MGKGITVGIDPALGGTGLAIVNGDELLALTLIKTAPSKGLRDRLERFMGIAKAVCDGITAQVESPAMIAIEGYSFAAKGAMHHDVVEAGGILRMMVCANFPQAEVIEVPPSALKKFCCGDGMAQKRDMRRVMEATWGRKLVEPNSADAFGLAMLAAVLTKQVAPKFHYQAETAEKMRAKLSPCR